MKNIILIILLIIAVWFTVDIWRTEAAAPERLPDETLEKIKVIKEDKETKVQINVFKKRDTDNPHDSYRLYVEGLNSQLRKGRTFQNKTGKQIVEELETRLQADLDALP